ncbi:MAG: hypothetical protein HYX94_00200 [Chloroflexi bacterium]|nr:hypothetical protein [Chloroflexota bacterium]
MNLAKERKSTQNKYRRRWHTWRDRLILLAMVIAIALPNIGPTYAATGSLYARLITAPGGGVWMGAHFWVADHLMGFCRLDAGADGSFAINQSTCNTAAVSPGQPAYDAANGYVYVPDNSSKSRGVWRLVFDSSTETVGSPVPLAATARLGANRPTATALGPDGKLYVGFIKNGDIKRLTTPTAAAQTVESVGRTSDGRGVSGMTYVGSDLYLAQGGAVTKIANAPGATGGSVAQATPLIATAPTAIVSDGVNVIYVAETPVDSSSVLRYTISTNTQDIYATRGNMPPSGTPTDFKFVSGLSLDSSGNLYVGDDPSDGALSIQGHLWWIAAGSAPEVEGTPGGGTPAPPPAPALTDGSPYADQITAPGGGVWMGTHYWVADHLMGLCRVDQNTDGTLDINQSTCNTAAVSPGQPSYDAANGYVYVPDNSSKSAGVWRLQFNSTTETVGNPALVAANAGLGGNRPTATALQTDGSLYVGFIKNGDVKRITTPYGVSQTVRTIGRSSDGRGISGLALLGADLYLAEGAAVTKIAKVANVVSGATAQRTSIVATAPTAIAAGGMDALFVADTPVAVSNIIRYTVSVDVQELYAKEGTTGAGATTPFKFVSGLTLDTYGNLYVGDDPSDGASSFQGHIWKVVGITAEYAEGITAPGGGVWLGSHLWVSDHLMGFCRLDLGLDGEYGINQNTCSTAAVSPGQPSFDRIGYVYIPDNSSKSKGVWRLQFDGSTETAGNPVLIAANAGLGGSRPTATALGPDGNLYVGSIKNGDIKRITTPAGASQTVQSVGRSSDGRGVAGLAFVDSDLYLAEGNAVTKITSATGASGGTAQDTPITAVAPTAIASDGADVIYIADTPVDSSSVLRYTLSTGTQDIYATKCVNPTYGTLYFKFVSGLTLDGSGNLYVADDPSDGALSLQGHVFRVLAGSNPEVAGAPGGGTPPPPPTDALTTGSLYAGQITAPGGGVWMGTHYWVADHLMGFCRPDTSAGGQYTINQSTCNTAAASPGQPSYDAANSYVYLPDNSSKGKGVWRLQFNSAGEAVGSPFLLAAGAGLTGSRPTATAIGPDGSLYVGSIKNGDIKRIINPAGTTQAVQTIGRSSDSRGVAGLAFVGTDFYLVEGVALTKIANATAASSGATAQQTSLSVTAPTAVASNGVDTLYVADTPVGVSDVWRYDVNSHVQEVYANAAALADGSQTTFKFVSGLTLDWSGNLYVGDDPSDGQMSLQGHIWRVAPAP